jgi:hypothetical protein
MSAAIIAKGLLESAGLGTSGATSGWRLGCGVLTDKPDTQVVINDAPSEHPDPKWLLDYPYIQVMVRGAIEGYQEARQKIQDAYDVLLGYPPGAVTGGRIDGITALGSPAFIGNDQLERPCFSLNLRMIFEPAASALSHRTPLA